MNLVRAKCIDATHSTLTYGEEYMIEEGDSEYTEVYRIDAMPPPIHYSLRSRFEVIEEEGIYIIWSPESPAPPTKTFSHKQAKKVARKMAADHQPAVFYVTRATEKYSVKTEVVKEVL